MVPSSDRILLVENDREINGLIARQALQTVGFRMEIAGDAPAALRQMVESPPDLILADLNFPGLGTKDILVALASHGLKTPVSVLADRGQEQAGHYSGFPARGCKLSPEASAASLIGIHRHPATVGTGR